MQPSRLPSGLLWGAKPKRQQLSACRISDPMLRRATHVAVAPSCFFSPEELRSFLHVRSAHFRICAYSPAMNHALSPFGNALFLLLGAARFLLVGTALFLPSGLLILFHQALSAFSNCALTPLKNYALCLRSFYSRKLRIMSALFLLSGTAHNVCALFLPLGTALVLSPRHV